MSEIGKRYLEVLDRMRVTSKERRVKYNISPSTQGHWKTEENRKPTTDQITLLLKDYPSINERWLLLDEGEMIKNSTDSFNIEDQKTINQLNQLITKLLTRLDEKNNKIIELLESAKNKQ